MAQHDGNGWVECRCGLRHWGRHGAAGLLVARPEGPEDPPNTRPGDGPAPGADERPTDGPGALAGPDAPAGPGIEILLQLRAAWTHQGGTWGLPGGARDSHEDVVTAALREAREETGLEASSLCVVGEHPGVEHVDWSYTYVIARAPAGTPVLTVTAESDELRWVRPPEVASLPLHPAFGAAWPDLLRVLPALVR